MRYPHLNSLFSVSCAILNFLGVRETIGQNKDEYISIAVRLGNDTKSA
jgi:predicted O-linked N-acetylglucosamine transferase (SPINDLY family)